jgi:acetyl esterase/lipase
MNRIVVGCLLILAAATATAAEPHVVRDVAYAEPQSVRRTLDLYAPEGAKNRPIVFWIHGGGWRQGDKSGVLAKPQAFVDRGYVFVATNYRFVPHVSIGQMAGDVAKALRWTHEHAAEHGGDPNRIFVMGHSAGAQLAALVCTDHSYVEAEGLSPAILKGCVPVDGDTYDVPLQIATVERRRKDFYIWEFGDDAQQRKLSPITYVERGKPIPPVLVVHVAEHPETKMQSEKFVDALKRAGFDAATFRAADTDHVKLNAMLGTPDDPASAAIYAFVERLTADQ